MELPGWKGREERGEALRSGTLELPEVSFATHEIGGGERLPQAPWASLLLTSCISDFLLLPRVW